MSWGALIVIAAAFFVGLAWYVSWWFLLAIPGLLLLKLPMLLRRSRVLSALARYYQYEFPPTAPQAYTLNQMERDTRGQNLNDLELATLFMAVMCNTLTSERLEVRVFCRKVHDDATRLRDSQAISEGVFSQLDEVIQRKLGARAT